MTERRKNGQMSDNEIEIRRFHRSVRRLKSWCRDQDINLKSWSEANNEDQCVLSLVDYELGAIREYLPEDNESYFVNEDFYEEVSDEAIYL